MPKQTEMVVEIIYEKREGNRYFLRSQDIPGFRLEGGDFDKIQADLGPVVIDLLEHNMGFSVESFRWIPTPEEVKQHLDKPHSEGKVRYVARLKAAA
jgi:hypothetical protein